MTLYVGLVGRPETHHGTPVNVTASAGSVFAPSWVLVRSVQPPALSRHELVPQHPRWKTYAGRYVSELRAKYRRDRAPFVDLVEQAAVGDVTLCCLCHWATEERPVCHRFLLRDVLYAVARDRGLWVGQEADELDMTLLEQRRRQVLEAEGKWLSEEAPTVGSRSKEERRG